MDGYVENVNFCEYCGNILNEGGRCPDEECVWNLLLDVMSDTEEGESAADDATEDDAEVIEESSDTTSVEEQTKDVATKEEPSEGAE